MIFVTALLAAHLLPQIRSVKVVLDGTIDFGPNWNFAYKLNPISGAKPRKRISDDRKVFISSENINARAPEQENATNTVEILRDTNKSHESAAIVAEDDNTDGEIHEEKLYEVTKLYEQHTKKDELFKSPRKIKDETEVVTFVDRIKNESLKMFDDVRDKLDGKDLVEKIYELKQRYSMKFGDFENQTKRHTIRTTLGSRNVILNTIDYSNKLLNRLINRFKIDTEDRWLRSRLEATKTLQEHTNNLRKLAYEDACRMFSICRTGNEFSDHISYLITTLLEHDDSKVQAAVTTTAKILKSTDFSRIMDKRTQESFRRGLSTLEELTPFELRVLLMAYKLVIDNRHQPFSNRNPKNAWVKATVAMFHVIEGFNRKVILDTKHWNAIKKDFNGWLAGDDADITDIAQRLVGSVRDRVAALDDRTANDFKTHLRLCVAAKTLRINLGTYVQFQPFVL